MIRNETTCLKTETKFFLIPTHEITSNQLLSKDASKYEESAEVWLHRGFERMECYRTMEPKEADVFLIAGYLHLAGYRQEATGYAKLLMKRLYNKTKPHIVLTPTWNKERSLKAGIADLVVTLKEGGVNLWLVGFERNEKWQHLNARQIIPIPYVMTSFVLSLFVIAIMHQMSSILCCNNKGRSTRHSLGLLVLPRLEG